MVINIRATLSFEQMWPVTVHATEGPWGGVDKYFKDDESCSN